MLRKKKMKLLFLSLFLNLISHFSSFPKFSFFIFYFAYLIFIYSVLYFLPSTCPPVFRFPFSLYFFHCFTLSPSPYTTFHLSLIIFPAQLALLPKREAVSSSYLSTRLHGNTCQKTDMYINVVFVGWVLIPRSC
jgi:hypothetical protein